ncbi:hypothetical protein [Alsobacter sp. R-9]
MPSRWPVVGYAIVSADDRIADAQGRMPDSLKNEADWQRFQAALDAAAVTVLGRLGHEAHPNGRNRLRMVVSTGVAGLERRPDGWWWNPQKVAFASAIAEVVPAGGEVAVPGGQGVFDLFLGIGYDAFHLTRARGVTVPGGRGVFAAVERGTGAEALLGAHGLAATPPVSIDAAAAIDLTVWTRR